MNPDTPTPDHLDDLLDRLVAEYSDHMQAAGGKSGAGEPDPEEFLQRVPAEHRPALDRCLRMIRAGIASAPSRARPLGPGVVLDGYRIEREIGRGGMATVYLAEHLDLQRMVALKVLRPGLAVDGRHVDRFRREALAVAKLQHQHIVQIHAVGEADGYHYLAMEYVDGKNLSQVMSDMPPVGSEPWTAAHLAEASGIEALKDPTLSYESAVARMLMPVARAVAVAHELGMVHRDIKPSNILIHKDGRALIADFGLAKASEDPALSMTGEPVGTPYYMSPEQAELKAHRVDERSDVYSLGVTLYECMTGSRPFEGETALEVLEAIRSSHPKSLRVRAPERSRGCEAVVQKAMARRQEDRYATAIDLAAELTALAEGRPTQAKAEQGSPLRRLFSALRQMTSQQGYEYVSARRFLGMPLVHINCRRREIGDGMRRARGWLAVGDIAIGGIAIGPMATGLLALGALGIGLLSFAGMAIGLYSFAGMSAGVFPTGGLSFGYCALGGVSFGYYAVGGICGGVHTIGPLGADPAAVEMFSTWMPWVSWILPQ